MLKLNEIIIDNLVGSIIKISQSNYNIIKELREQVEEPINSDVSIGTIADIDIENDYITIHYSTAKWTPENCFDTKIIAKVAKIRMSLN